SAPGWRDFRLFVAAHAVGWLWSLSCSLGRDLFLLLLDTAKPGRPQRPASFFALGEHRRRPPRCIAGDASSAGPSIPLCAEPARGLMTRANWPRPHSVSVGPGLFRTARP